MSTNKWTNTTPREVAVSADTVGGICDCHRKIGNFCAQERFKEDPRVYLGGSTVVVKCTPSTDAPGEKYCRGAQNGPNKHPGLCGVHHARAIAGMEEGRFDARGDEIATVGKGRTQRGSRNQVKTLLFCLFLYPTFLYVYIVLD